MKKLISIFAVFLLAASLSACRSNTKELEVRLINHTGYNLAELYATPANAELDKMNAEDSKATWGKNLIQEAVFANDSSANVKIVYEEEVDLWDFMAVSTDGNSSYWTDIDLSKTTEYELTAPIEKHKIRLINSNEFDIYEIYIARTEIQEGEEWGPNRLETGSVIPSSGSAEVAIEKTEEILLFDIMAMDKEGNTFFWNAVDIFNLNEYELKPQVSEAD